eukprot:scaffold58807_cov64-Attheya_sp.AAC.1
MADNNAPRLLFIDDEDPEDEFEDPPSITSHNSNEDAIAHQDWDDLSLDSHHHMLSLFILTPILGIIRPALLVGILFLVCAFGAGSLCAARIVELVLSYRGSSGHLGVQQCSVWCVLGKVGFGHLENVHGGDGVLVVAWLASTCACCFFESALGVIVVW